MTEEVGRSKLVVGMLRSADIASNLLDAIKFQADLDRLALAHTAAITETAKTLKSAQNLSQIALKDGYTILKTAIEDFPHKANFLIQMQRNQVMQSAAGYRMTASLMGQEAKLFAQNNFTDLYGSLIYDMPEAYIREKVKRFYNNMYRIGELDVAFATRMYNKGKIAKTLWHDTLANHGIPDKIMPLILDDVDQKPAIGTALRMYQFIDIDDKSLIWLMNENNITMPQIQQLWLRYFHANRLRDEMAMYKNYLLAAYQDGLLSDAQLTSEFATFKSSKEEVEHIVANQKAEFMRRITRLETETRLWLYRKGVFASTLEVESTTTNNGAENGSTMIDTNRTEVTEYFDEMFMLLETGQIRIITSWNLTTHTFTFFNPFDEQVLAGVKYKIYSEIAEDTLFKQLSALSINSALVNAMVRLEAAKKGIEWEKA